MYYVRFNRADADQMVASILTIIAALYDTITIDFDHFIYILLFYIFSKYGLFQIYKFLGDRNYG